MRVRYRYVTLEPDSVRSHPADEVERLFHEVLELGRTRSGTTGHHWHPPTDMYELPDRFVIKMDLAGVREDEIDVSLFSDHMTISGHRHPTSFDPDVPVAYHVAGILYGAFRTDLRLPNNIAGEKVEAQYEQGFLTIVLPKLQN